jgi:opacity protein-like surface antigen
MKKFLLLLFIPVFISLSYADQPAVEKAQGVFLALGVGPRFPVSSFSNTSVTGYGLNCEISYTDDECLPFFLFGKFGFEHFAGSNKYYLTSDISNLSTSLYPISFGARYYFQPILENFMILIPHIEVSANYCITHYLYEYKIDANKNNYTNNKNKFGFSVGAGLSIFLVELLASYNYYSDIQYFSCDLKIRIPLYVNL